MYIINVSQEQNQNRRIDLFEGDSDKLIISTRTESNSVKNSLANLKTGLLFDLTAGFARIGPSLGARYVINFEQNFNYFQFYGIWKF